MWFLGAGASASAGIATAWDMIWEFKQRLFVSQRRVSPQAVADLSSPAVRAQLQAHIDSLEGLPAPGAADEYAALFEAVYPAEGDRRAYLDAKMAGAKPSYGHLALATLMRARLTRLVWTTNFDPLIADSCAKVYDSTGALTTVALDAPELAEQCIRDGRWPVEVKLHGDFRSRRLKNTSDELRDQDQRLRRLLVESSRRLGLVVVGYGGRDDSIMESLEQVLAEGESFPAGLFWLHRGEDPPLDRVQRFLLRAKQSGVETGLVPVENFDEIMRDVVRMIENLDTKELNIFAADRRRWSGAPRPSGKRGWPMVRLNGLPIIEMPTMCRRIVCDIGGYGEVRKTVDLAGVDVLVARTKLGVLAYGGDTDLRRAFQGHGITDFDLHVIEPRRLRYESGERGLLQDALNRAIGRGRGLDVIPKRVSLLAPSDPTEEVWKPLKKLVGSLGGEVPGHAGFTWSEGISTRLDWADDRLWLMIEPRTVFHGMTDENKHAASDFARGRTVKRYNRQLNDLLAFWADVFVGGGDNLRALGIADGVDAVFKLSSATAFSRRSGA
ncbi:MAG: SIR2 family protein [Gemmatimonadetes bacterium]|nr:SIR2 family protein [Gemmatimonadota bacterium]